jgi:hypothetical protein
VVDGGDGRMLSEVLRLLLLLTLVLLLLLMMLK